MARGLIVNHCGLATILPPKVKFNQGYGMDLEGGLVSRGTGGPEPPSCVLEKLKNVESPWKSIGSSEVLESAMSMMG